MVQQDAEITKMQKLLATDDEIIGLRVKVKEAAKAQLDNGVITANDYLREVNAEDQARQTKITHQLQLLQARINYKKHFRKIITATNEKSIGIIGFIVDSRGL